MTSDLLEENQDLRKQVEELKAGKNANEDEILELRKDKMRLEKNNIRLKFIIKRLLANRPDTYSGTDVETNQIKMFAFSSAVDDAIEYLKEE
jgi:predicted nuclease with TOPRIM domain